MKAIFIFLVASFLLPAASFASQVGCDQTVKMAVEKRLADAGSSEVIQILGEVGPHFTELRTFSVTSEVDYPPGIVGIQYTTTFLVVARTLAPGVCNVESIIVDVKAQ